MRTSPATRTASRRAFLAAAGALTVASGLRADGARAQTKARWRRLNLSDPAFPMRVLDSYQRAIKAMLALPPTDPRNWYRNALVHTLDCPHGNWWLPPWHRGYTAWFEQTCRELSGDPDFALPFWDWTATPRIPAAFFGNLLDPTSPGFIASLAEFQSAFTGPMQAYWSNLSPGQLTELGQRGYNSMADVWAQVVGNPMFFPSAQARTLTKAAPDLLADGQKAVSIATVRAALAPRDYLSFGSPKAPDHSALVGFSILEGQPHNLVHNDISGFMQDFLSPVDPIFFMHHSNIDRLWDVWTRKQQALGLPTLPTGADLQPWSSEPFLFFHDASGKPVAKTKAGDYATIGDFDYDYQAGSGEDVVAAPPVLVAGAAPARLGAAVDRPALAQSATATVAVPEVLLRSAAQAGGPALVATVTMTPEALAGGARFDVLLNPPGDTAGRALGSPHHVATLALFGRPHHLAGPVTFAVPLSGTLTATLAAGRLNVAAPLRVEIVPRAGGAALAPGAQLLSVAVHAP